MILAHNMPLAGSLAAAPCSTYFWSSFRTTVELPISRMTGGVGAGGGPEGLRGGDGRAGVPDAGEA